jgi:uncharacterized protein (DUF2252 family)
VKNWTRLEEKRSTEKLVTYTSKCGRYVISKLYAYDWNEGWYFEYRNYSSIDNTIIHKAQTFKEIKQFANNYLKAA